MKNTTPKPRIVIEFDPEHIQALDRVRRNVGLSRTNFARVAVLQHVLAAETATPLIAEATR